MVAEVWEEGPTAFCCANCAPDLVQSRQDTNHTSDDERNDDDLIRERGVSWTRQPSLYRFSCKQENTISDGYRDGRKSRPNHYKSERTKSGPAMANHLPTFRPAQESPIAMVLNHQVAAQAATKAPINDRPREKILPTPIIPFYFERNVELIPESSRGRIAVPSQTPPLSVVAHYTVDPSPRCLLGLAPLLISRGDRGAATASDNWLRR